MKKQIILLLLAFLPILGVGQGVTVYTKQQVDAKIDSLGKLISKTPVIPPVGPEKSPCKAGPEIRGISNVSATYLNVLFHGEGVTELTWRILNTDRAGVVAPVNNQPGITFSTLQPGNYTLEIEGKSCKSAVSQKAFILPGSTGVVDPPVIVVPPDGQARLIEQVIPFPGHMNLDKKRIPGGWLYTDLVERKALGLGDEWAIWYLVNGKLIIIDQLKDYFVSDKAHAVSITKTPLRRNVTALWQVSKPHGGNEADQGYFSPGMVYAARASDIIISDNTLFPANYDPYKNQRVQFQDLISNSTASEDYIFAIPKGQISIEKAISKGINRFSGGTLYNLGEPKTWEYLSNGYGYNEVPISPTIFGWKDHGGSDDWIGPNGRYSQDTVVDGKSKKKGEPRDEWDNVWNRRFLPTPDGAQEPMTYDEGLQAGRNFGSMYTANVLETSEQSHAISSKWPFVKGFSETWHDGLENQWKGTGKTILTAWNYFSDTGVNTRYGSPSERKELFRKDLNAWPRNPILPGGNLERFTAYCVPMYYNFVDAGYDIAYQLAFEYYVRKKTGKKCIVFPAATLENNPNGAVEWRLPEGKYYHKDKLPQDPSIMITAGAFSYIFNDALIPWAFPSYNENPFRIDLRNVAQNWTQIGMWVPNGNSPTEIADVNSSPVLITGTQTTPGQGVTDNLVFGKKMAEVFFAETKGGADEWLSYSVDGGKWYTPVNSWADDVVNAYESKAPIAFARMKNGVASVLICNAGATDVSAHKIDYKLNGSIYSVELAGITPFMRTFKY